MAVIFDNDSSPKRLNVVISSKTINLSFDCFRKEESTEIQMNLLIFSVQTALNAHYQYSTSAFWKQYVRVSLDLH